MISIGNYDEGSVLFRLSMLCLIFVGANQKKLLEINIGFIGVLVQVMIWIFSSGIHIFCSAIVLIVCGGLLLFVNLKLVKSKGSVPQNG